MSKNLVIVESPAKARTLGKYLGADFEVRASMGHVIDLPEKKLGVDLEQDFKPTYQVIPGKNKVINELKRAAGSAGAAHRECGPGEGSARGRPAPAATGCEETLVKPRVSVHDCDQEP